MNSNEAEILFALKNNHQQTIQQVYRKYLPVAYQLVLKNSGTEQEAKDIYQESFILFYEKLKDNLVLTCSIKTFLYSVCRRQWLKRLKEKNLYYLKLQDNEEFILLDSEHEYFEQREKEYSQMESCLLRLGEPCRTLLTDFYHQNRSMEEIAEKFGYTTADNAKNQKYKCLQRLKKLFFENSNRVS